MSTKQFRISNAFCGMLGVVTLISAFIFAWGPPANATLAQQTVYVIQHHNAIAMGAWLQTIGTLLCVLFAIGIIHLAGATKQFAGWMTIFGGTVLMMVSIVEVTFYFSAVSGAINHNPMLLSISGNLMDAIQHAYSMVAVPIVFLPLGVILLRSHIIPHIFGYLALLLGVTFAVFGVVCLFVPAQYLVNDLSFIQGLWWLASAITLLFYKGNAIEQA
jgi:hypothetical protein